jgi:hypothetical protein
LLFGSAPRSLAAEFSLAGRRILARWPPNLRSLEVRFCQTLVVAFGL